MHVYLILTYKNCYIICIVQLPLGGNFLTGLQKQLDASKILQESVVPTEPPAEFEFIADPPSISAFDL